MPLLGTAVGLALPTTGRYDRLMVGERQAPRGGLRLPTVPEYEPLDEQGPACRCG
jgi:hypothetical protein